MFGNGDWDKNALSGVQNFEQQGYSNGISRGNSSFDPARDTAMAMGGTGGNMVNDPSYGGYAMQQLAGGQLSNLNPNSFQMSPFTSMTANPGQYMNVNNALGGVAGNNGLLNSNQYNAQGTANTMLNGAFYGQPDLYNTGKSMMANNGQSPFTQNLQRTAMDVTGGAGQTAATNFGLNAAQQLISNGGLNNAGAAGQNTALAGLQGGGNNNLTNTLEGTGMNFAQQPAVLSTGTAASIAEDQAHQQAINSARAAQAQALARGGAPGASVANGAANSAEGDFFNQIQQNSANAYENALLNQQGLNLQQQGQGAQMALGAGNVASQQLGTYGNLLSQLTSTANSGIGTGLSSIGGLQNAQTNLAGTYGQLGIGAGNLANNTAATGGQLTSDFLNSAVSGGNLQNNLLGTQANTLIGAGNGYNSNMNNAGNLNLQGANSYYNNYNGLYNDVGNANNLGYNLWNSAEGGLNNQAQMGYGMANTALGAMPSVYSSFTSNGGGGGLAGTMISAAGQAAGGYLSKP